MAYHKKSVSTNPQQMLSQPAATDPVAFWAAQPGTGAWVWAHCSHPTWSPVKNALKGIAEVSDKFLTPGFQSFDCNSAKC